MNVNRQQFEMWFKEPIEKLQVDTNTKENAGYAILLISIPLLERYLREKSGAHETTPAPPAFYDALCTAFPEIPRAKALAFYGIFRNGLTHQVTIRATPGAAQGQIQNAGDCITYDVPTNHFSINPAAFAQRVLATIEADFPTFEAPGSPNHPLGQIVVQGQTPVTMSINLSSSAALATPQTQGTGGTGV